MNILSDLFCDSAQSGETLYSAEFLFCNYDLTLWWLYQIAECDYST